MFSFWSYVINEASYLGAFDRMSKVLQFGKRKSRPQVFVIELAGAKALEGLI